MEGQGNRRKSSLSPFAALNLSYPRHDKAGNRKERKEDATSTSYAYDALYQLTQAKTGAAGENFTYDLVGNRTSGPTVKDTEADYEHDDANRMTKGRKFDYAYDDFGNQEFCYLDAAYTKYWQYAWDGENRLIEAKMVKNGATLRTVTFKYDPFGRRRQKKVVEGATTTTYTFVYDAEDIALEYKAVQVGSGSPVTTRTHYVHGPGIDEPLARVQGTTKHFFHADGLGSIVAITDSAQAVKQRYTYESFGMLTPQDPAFENAYTYTGREWGKEIGLYYYNARYYDPMEGRFISKDPIGFAGGDVNLFAYTKNNPINFIDPYGLFEIYVWDPGERNGVTYGGFVTVMGQNGRSITVRGSSWSNPGHPNPGISEGSYNAIYSATGHRGRTNGVRLRNGALVPTEGPNPAQGLFPYADGVNMHCGYSPTRRGSAGCITIEPSSCEQVWNVLQEGERGTVRIERSRNGFLQDTYSRWFQ